MKSIETTTTLGIEEAESAVRASLAEHGFGVITEIDMAATLRAKIGVERPPLKILGACNPALAHAALQLDETVGLMLPCNVVLSAVDGGTRVSIADPRELSSGPEFDQLAADAAAKLAAALEVLP